MFFEVICKSIVNHSFEYFTETARESYRSVIVGVCGVLSRLRYRNNDGSPPGFGELPLDPETIENI